MDGRQQAQPFCPRIKLFRVVYLRILQSVFRWVVSRIFPTAPAELVGPHLCIIQLSPGLLATEENGTWDRLDRENCRWKSSSSKDLSQ